MVNFFGGTNVLGTNVLGELMSRELMSYGELMSGGTNVLNSGGVPDLGKIPTFSRVFFGNVPKNVMMYHRRSGLPRVFGFKWCWAPNAMG